MRLRILSSLAALLALMFAAMFASSATSAATADGVYVIVDASQPDQFPAVTAALQVPGVDGLLIHLRWGQISDGFMHYNWTSLDNAIALATAANKRYELGIVTGSAMPQWVTAPAPKGLGAAHATFNVDATVGGGCTTFVMAPPYDPGYQAAFRDLLIKLAAHLRGMKTYASLAMLKLDGITTTTDELRLPALNIPASECANANSIKTWLSLGYTPGKVRSAWDSMLHTFLVQFPNKSFNIGFIGVNAFPGIMNNGTVAPTDAARAALSAQFAANLIGDAGRLMPGRVALGFDSLTLTVPQDDASYPSSLTEYFTDASNAGARLGWQTNELCGQYSTTGTGGCSGANCTINTCSGVACSGSSKANAVPCTNSAQFQALLLAGLLPNNPAAPLPESQGVYLEIFPQNANAWPAAVRKAHQNLAPW
ncbi:MAG TPA: hypothetical protein VGG48_10675 [Rhizomicrobium sp.]|jgi:hypothetical protein